MNVSAPARDRVDIEIYQIVCQEMPEVPSVSLSLPLDAVDDLISVLKRRF